MLPSTGEPPAQRPPTAPGAPAPVARIDTGVPEKPRKYADADLGPTWFATKPKPEQQPDPGPEPKPEPQPEAKSGPEPGTHVEERPGPNPGTASETARDAAAGSAGTTAADANPGRTSPEDGEPAAADTAGVVLDLDLTGLLNGLTADEAVLSPQSPAPRPAATTGDAGSPDAGLAAAGRTATAPSLMPGPEPTEPKTAEPKTTAPKITAPKITAPKTTGPARRPLSAADLEAIRWRLDGATLREVVDDRDALRELGDRLDEPLSQDADNVTRSGLLSVRAEVYRLLGELGMAAAASRLALAHAESAGDRQAVVIAQAELAHVLRLRGDFGEADRLFEEAASSESPDWLRSVVHENAGRSCFDQGRNMEALDHFARAIRLGPPADRDLVERIDVCLEAVYIHILRDGWGPYPRLRQDILGPVRAASRPAPG